MDGYYNNVVDEVDHSIEICYYNGKWLGESTAVYLMPRLQAPQVEKNRHPWTFQVSAWDWLINILSLNFLYTLI